MMRRDPSTGSAWLWVLALSGLVVWQLAATPEADAQPGKADYVIHYFKQPRGLVLNVDAVALLDRQVAPSPQGQAARDEEGLLAIDPDPVAVPGWSVASAPLALRSAAAIEKLVAGLAGAGAADFVSPVFRDDFGGPLVVTPDLFVGFQENVAPPRARAILDASGVGAITAVDYDGMPGVYRVRASSRNGFEVLAAANALVALPEVSFAEPDMIFTGRADLVPDDPNFVDEWGIHNTGQTGACNAAGTNDVDMDGPEAWNVTTGDPAIRVVIIDSGYQLNHPDLNHSGFAADFTSDGGNGGPVYACDNHGTAVAGCVAAVINNNTGGVGIAPGCTVASARIGIPVQTDPPCTTNFNTQPSWVANAINWAQSTAGARVTNNSNSLGNPSALIDTAYQNTRNAGLIHFASAGNDSSSTIAYPASLPTVNAVAAIDQDGDLASFSNFGTGLDFSAPGVDVLTTDRTGNDGVAPSDVACVNGTSFASPYAAGVAALILSVDASLTPDQVESIMQQTATDVGAAGYDTSYGWGIVNAYLAVHGPSCPPSSVAYWSFDADFAESCGNTSYDGVPVGIAHVESKNAAPIPANGGCLVLPGGPSRVNLPQVPPVSTPIPQGTIEAWVYLESPGCPATGFNIFNEGIAAAHTDLAVGLNCVGDVYHARLWVANGGTPVVVLPGFSLATWHHLACTWGGGMHRYYMDGVLRAALCMPNTPQFTGNEAEIGSDDQEVGYWIGRLDEIRLSNVILNANQFADGYFATPGDLDGDGDVDTVDFVALLAAWGPCPQPCPPSCPADFDGDCQVGIVDFLTLLGNWG